MAAVGAMTSSDKVPVEVRFKIVEWWQDAKGRFNNTIKMAFK